MQYSVLSGTVIGNLVASDADSTEVFFSLDGALSNDLLRLQKTGPYTADIILKSELDREVRKLLF